MHHQYDEEFEKAYSAVENAEYEKRLTKEEADIIERALATLVNCLDDYVDQFGSIRKECDEIFDEDDEYEEDDL